MKTLKLLLSITIALLNITVSLMIIKALTEDDDISEYKRSGD